MRRAVRDDLGQSGQREIGRGEGQIPITALEARLGFERDACTGEAALRPGTERPFDAVFEAGGMRAAAHAFAMRIEDQRGDIGQPVGGHRLRQSPL